MASPQVTSQLQVLESAHNDNHAFLGYNNLLAGIISKDATIVGNDDNRLPANLAAYVQSIISDHIGVIHSRPLLSAFVEQFRTITDDDAKLEAGTQIVDLLAPRMVSYEQQDTDIKLVLADAYEADNDFINSAKTLQTIPLDSTQRTLTDDDRARVWMRITRCYLEDDDPTAALTHLNKVKRVIHDVTDATTRLQFQLSQARIHDAQRQFLDASTQYLAISTQPVIDEEERLHMLSAAITTAVLAPAGPPRARQLGKLYKDERAPDTPSYAILEKIFLDRLLDPAEVAAFAASLAPHQLAKTADGSTVLDKAVLEHNLLAASRLYANISTAELGTLLGVDAERAEGAAAAMMESRRLPGSIDQIAGVIHFHKKDGGSDDVVAVDLRAWDANIQGLAEEVEKVTTMLQREEPAFYESVMVA